MGNLRGEMSRAKTNDNKRDTTFWDQPAMDLSRSNRVQGLVSQ